MRTTPHTFLVASALLLAGCTENSEETTQASSNQNAPASKNATMALNPPHGEPGHNCALPVGAPLDGTPLPRLIRPNLSPITPAGMNPPHGQPGHDCSIPVGAPLGSK
ncbi:hypothetical protein [Pontibacter mangrovi]|uniref:Lipoprotein n=1 Tax=Pontibacter mangrovi TaxID=2589816 RepID=A0A501W3B1_9BACT|nr:hypothetical protein [Pontibacter mangrovi]TPE44089.1 hypothetical protein FJM65_11780 [Pontibacter mangrovi]